MRLPVRSRSRGLRFNITPLIDVVFLLVIFFLVASHFARSEPTEMVNLPKATQSAEDEQARRLVITVNQDGEYFVNAENVTLAEIEQMIQDGAGVNPESYAVRIRGDRTTPYAAIEPIMLACPKYGVIQFGFHVIENDNS